MKKTRIFQSVMMLLACVALLAIGVYAISPAQNNVTGTITVIASNVEVEITAYMGANKATRVSDTITARTSTPVPIYDNKLEFDGSSVANSDAVADMTMVLEIKNKSASKALGAFFLKDATLPATLTRSNITTSMDFDGKTSDNTKTATDLVTVALQDYTEIGAGQTVDLICTFSLNSLTDYDMNVDFTLPLVIHDYDETLVKQTGSVTIGTESDKSVAIETTIGDNSYNNGVISSTTKLRGGLSEVAFTTESTDPIEVTLSVTNQTSTELGVYFLDPSVSESVAYDSDGLVTADGIMVKTQINQAGNVIDVYLSTYSYLAVSSNTNDYDSIEMYITFYPTTIISDCEVMFNFNLNIEEYVSNMDADDLTTSSWTSSNGRTYNCVQSIPGSLIKISSSVTSISAEAFAHGTTADGWYYLGRPAEWGDMVTKYIVVPSGATSVGNGCFMGNKELLGVSIPSITSEAYHLFRVCESLLSVNLCNDLTIITALAFMNCTSLEYIKLPEYIRTIEMYAFMNCSALRYIAIPRSVTYMGDSVFAGLNNLTKIVVKQGDDPLSCYTTLPTISGKTWYLNGVEVTTTTLARSATCDNVYICK